MENEEQKTILVVDDEEPIRELLTYNLEKEGYKVIEAVDGEQAIRLVETEKIDLILLDIMLPKKDGISVCKYIRYSLNMLELPILMISARGEETDKIVGLEIGADDYITKPFQVREVMARIKANLRKADATRLNKDDVQGGITVIGDLEIDALKREVKVRGKIIELTKKEFDVLKYLADQRGRVVSREDLLQQVWGYGEYVGEIRTIDVTMARLRDKIERKKGDPEFLITKRGVGYYIADNNEEN